LMAAGFLFLARIIGLGFLADFLSRTVLVGFLTGVGIQVALGQIAGMLGLEGGGHGTIGKILRRLAKINCWFRLSERGYNSTRRGTYPA
jgi:MFS superfamily sulfate permease-like transporter